MTWADPVGDLRKLLSDGPTDKLRYRKKVLNPQNGVNVTFKTFEFRRITDFTTATAPAGVYVDDVLAVVSADDPSGTGEFTLATPPTDGQVVRATYNIQWFTDDELIEFLTTAAQWIGVSDDYTEIPSGLQPAAKEFAAHQAYQKLVLRWSENMSDVYQLFDAPDERKFDPIKTYMDISKAKFDLATKMRDDAYTRKGQALAPRSGIVPGYVQQVAPNR